jgi:probable rRNA maturation factor
MNQIQIHNAHKSYRIRRKETLLMVNHVLKGEHILNSEISIIFIDDKNMLDLNKTYLKHKYNTDVICFPFNEVSSKKIEGEIYINLNQARRQANEYKVTYSNEITRLVIHGVLHLLGYRDKNVRDKNRMMLLENQYLLKRTKGK